MSIHDHVHDGSPAPRCHLLALAALVCGLLLATGGRAAGEVQFIEGYTNRKSFVAGDTIRFHVSTNSPTFSIQIVRVNADGWSTVLRYDGISGVPKSVPDDGWLGADWEANLTTQVPAAWPTGSYFAAFITEDGARRVHPFIVRSVDPGSTSRILFVANFATRQAYNSWGGKSLYVSNVQGDPERARIVSHQRPFRAENGKGKGGWAAGLMHAYLESAGFDLEYATEWDIHLNPCLLRAYEIIVFAEHHEYISNRVYDALEAHQDRGGHLAFFSADDIHWQIRYQDDGRMIASYKTRASGEDPMWGFRDCLVTENWEHPLLGRPPEARKGIAVAEQSWRFESEDYRVQMPEHWMFEGTGLAKGDAFGTLVAAGEQDNLGPASPPLVDIVLSATRDVPRNPEDPPSVDFVEVLAVYFERGPAYGFPEGRGGAVFSAGTLAGWMLALRENGGPGWQHVRRVTDNIINHMLDHPPPSPPPGRNCPLEDSCFPVLADLNDDGLIDFEDLLVVLDQWGPCADCVADIDNDGTVDLTDLFGLLSHWNE